MLSQQSTLGLEVESDLGQFFTSDGAEVMETDLIRYLDNAHALHTELQEGAGYSYVLMLIELCHGYLSILLLSYSIFSGALGSPDLLH